MRLIRPTWVARAALACASFALAACDNSTEPSTPATITANSGTTVTGRAGTAVPVTVTVLTSNGKTLASTPVTFAVSTGGGAVSPGTATTDANGQASTSWTLGGTLGAQTLTITASGITQTVTATVSAGLPATVAVSAGAGQTAAVTTPVATAPAFVVKDAAGNPVSGVSVSFTSTPGGTVNPATVTTDASGIARVGSWVLGTQAGTYTLTANVQAAGVTPNPITVTATATAGSANRIDVGTGIAASGTVGTALAGNLPSVIVRDANGNPVQGATVTFTATTGGGTVTGGTQTTNAQGIATVGGFTLGQGVGPNVITASVPGAGSVNITINGNAGAASAATIVSGNNQSVGAGQALQVGPSIRVVDRFGNPVAGVPVSFVVTSGGGSVLGASQTTNAQGIATVGGFTLGPIPGTNTIVARVAGLPDIVFTAIGLAGAPVSITRVTPESTTVVTNTAQTNPLTVIVRDANGFPVQGATVSFAVTGGTGSLSSSTATTNANGQASVTFSGGGILGDATVTASVAGVATPSTFTITVQRSTPSTVTLIQGNNQTATVGSAVSQVPTVKVTDANGRAVPGVEVQFRIVAGGGSVDVPIDTTDANGIADAGQWRLGATAGQNVLSIVVSEPFITGNPVRLNATAIAAPTSASISIVQGNNQTAAAGSVVPVNPTVIVKDANGNVLQGVTVQFLPSGNGVANPVFATTDASGQASTTWRLSQLAGQNTLTAIVSGTGIVVNFFATGQ